MADAGPAEFGLEIFATLIHNFFEGLLGTIKSRGHVDVLRTLAREHEHKERRSIIKRCSAQDTTPVTCLERLHAILKIAANDCLPLAKSLSANLVGVRNVTHIQIRVLLQMLLEIYAGSR